MKKILLSAALLLGTMAANALPVQHSVGAVAGSLNGFEYKAYFQNKMVVAATLGVRASQSQGISWAAALSNNEAEDVYKQSWDLSGSNDAKFVYWTVEAAGNIGYQDNFKVMSAGAFSWFAGGGLSLGTIQMSDTWGHLKTERDAYNDLSSHDKKYTASPLAAKVGVNAYAGVEFKFRNLPLIVGCDFRPGLGMSLNGSKVDVVGEYKSYTCDMLRVNAFFDWALNASIRYYF